MSVRKPSDARETALRVLAKHRRSGGRLDALLASETDGLTPRDAALAVRLCYGVVQNCGLIDTALHMLIKKTQPQVLDILRLSVYQLWYLDRVPRYALTDEAVRLCKKTAPHAAGMVNSVLKKLPDTPPEVKDNWVRYSLPRFFCERMEEILPQGESEAFFQSCNTLPPLFVQRNTLKPYSDMPNLVPHGYVKECYRLEDPSGLSDILQSGWGIVADPAAKMCITALAPEPGMRIWDACAAPGGKTLMTAFEMQNKGFLLATDKTAGKLPLIKQSLSRCGITNTTVKEADAQVFLPPPPLFDAVLCDVPCSGFGVLRRKPDIRYRTGVSHYPGTQLAILNNAARAVKDGGVLVYCTCTLLPEENEGVVKTFLSQNGAFETVDVTTLWPHRGDTDGFFICKMKKKY